VGVSHIKLAKRTGSSVLQLSVVGFELQSKTAIELFFMQHQQSYALVPADRADVVIFDMEHPTVKPLIEECRGQRPIVAVTATEQQFSEFITLRKPLEGKRLIKAIQQAVDQFAPDTQQHSLRQSVSSEGEKAFQAYQKRLAAERQAIAEYRASSSDRALSSADVRQRFQLNQDDASSKASISGHDEHYEPVSLASSSSSDHQTLIPATAETESSSIATTATATTTATTTAPALDDNIEDEKTDDISANNKAKLTYQMVYECCGNAPDINLNEPDQRRRVFFKKDSTLLAILLEVINEVKARRLPVEVVGLPGTLAYLPESQQFLFDFSDDLLIPLALTRFGYQELTLNVRPDLEADSSSVVSPQTTIINRDELIWKLALWTSKGRLDRLINPEQPYKLSQSLDIERLLPIPHLATMASLWGRHRLSAIEVVKVLKIQQRYVFAFMTAAHALGAFE
jgi:hypothetical protein